MIELLLVLNNGTLISYIVVLKEKSQYEMSFHRLRLFAKVGNIVV